MRLSPPGATQSFQPPKPSYRWLTRPEARTQSPDASRPGSAEHRLDELERKVERILDALEKDPGEGSPRRSPAGQVTKPAAPPPPDVKGRLTKVNNMTGRVEVNIGSDDGLAPGHELTVYRVNPSRPSSAALVYLGRIRILLTDSHEAVGELIEWTGETTFKVGNLVLSLTAAIEGARAPSRQ